MRARLCGIMLWLARRFFSHLSVADRQTTAPAGTCSSWLGRNTTRLRPSRLAWKRAMSRRVSDAPGWCENHSGWWSLRSWRRPRPSSPRASSSRWPGLRGAFRPGGRSRRGRSAAARSGTLPAVAADGVVFAHGSLHPSHGLAQYRVARHMAMCIVDLFEMVEVDHDHAQWSVLPRRAFQFPLQDLQDRRAVPDAGKRVVSGLFAASSRAFRSSACSSTMRLPARSRTLSSCWSNGLVM